MYVKQLTTAFLASALGVCTFAAQASGNNWTPKQPANTNWQTPNWGGFNMPGYNAAPPPYNYNRPPPGYYGPANNQRQNYPNPSYSGQNNRPAPNVNRPANQNMVPPTQNSNRGYPPPPQGPYNGRAFSDNGASAFNTPGYHRYNNNRRNNKFWGRSGPSSWMNPNKRNMEDGWDDMINAPSRMGEMPGGWTAPEVTMPNPIDMGDQVQDNVEDLPDQMRNMDVGND